jgi:hypothetical protein
VSDKAEYPALCPSAPATPGAMLIGVVTSSGCVANLAMPLTIDATFIRTAEAYGALEERFRFSSPCAQGGCSNWTGSECGLIGQLYDAASTAGEELTGRPLPRCGIRAKCRWWAQRGRNACAVCPLVVTDTRSLNRHGVASL